MGDGEVNVIMSFIICNFH